MFRTILAILEREHLNRTLPRQRFCLIRKSLKEKRKGLGHLHRQSNKKDKWQNCSNSSAWGFVLVQDFKFALAISFDRQSTGREYAVKQVKLAAQFSVVTNEAPFPLVHHKFQLTSIKLWTRKTHPCRYLCFKTYRPPVAITRKIYRCRNTNQFTEK